MKKLQNDSLLRNRVNGVEEREKMKIKIKRVSVEAKIAYLRMSE